MRADALTDAFWPIDGSGEHEQGGYIDEDDGMEPDLLSGPSGPFPTSA